MIKLLNANFFRLKKSKLFFAVIVISILIACLMLFNSIANNAKYGLDSLFLNYTNMVGLIIATFVSLFIGKDYAYGTIRNKIIGGHSRINIYLSSLIISIVVSILAELVYVLFILIFGNCFIGKLEMSLFQFMIIMLNILMILIAYCSIFNAITLICSDITVATVINIILFLAMFTVCNAVFSIVNIPEYITDTFYDEYGNAHILEKEVNPNYPSEFRRNVCQTILNILPIGQSMQLSDYKENANTKVLMLYSFIVIVLSNAIGIYLFNKKELK